MAAQFNFTDNQWYCFICGLYSGLRLRQIDYEYDVPEFEYGANIKPITSNISATIGLQIGEVLGKQGDTVLVPVFTHDVNTAYSGFTARISYDTSQLRVLTIVSSGFASVGPVGSGADIEYQISSGVIQVVCTFDYGVSITQVAVLFYIQCSVTGEVYEDSPATLRFVNGGFTNMNYTTMLTYIVVGTEPVLYFITPLDNINGGIYSELSQTEVKLEGSSAAPSWAGSVVQGGYTNILPGGTGSFYVYAVVRDDPELGAPFPFDELRCGVSVGSDAIITDVRLINGTGSYSNATFVQNPTREGGFYGIMMEVTVKVREETESYKVPSSIPIHPTFGILKNYATGYTYTLNTVDGAISTEPPLPGKPFWGSYGSGGFGFGGVSVTASVWSPGVGALQVGIGSNDNRPVGGGMDIMGPTVSLHPGWNNISVVVPGSILPGVSGGSGGEPPGDNGYDITISVPDGTYIFIPVGGFQWVIIPGDDKPPDKLEPPSAIKETFKKAHFDGLKFRDEIVVQLEQGHEPTDIDGLIDEIEFTDYQLTEIQVLEPVYSNVNDEIEIVDFESWSSKTLTIKNSNQVDEIEFTDFAVAVFSQETPDLQADEVENLVIQDISDYQVVELTIKEGGEVDQVQFSDTESNTKVTLTISSQENTESIGLLDSNDYYSEPQGFMDIAFVEVKKGDYNE